MPPATSARVERAERLFIDAQLHFDAARYPEACARFEESQTLDPKLGTLLNLAFCHELEGKTATARAEFDQGATWAANKGQREREAFAREHLATLERKLSYVAFEVKAREDVERITLDGELLPPAKWGPPVVLDPGTHVLVVTGVGKQAREYKVDVASGPSSEQFLVRELESEARSGDFGPAWTTPKVPGATERRIGVVLAVTGLAAVVGGGVTGALTLGMRDEAKSHCVVNACDARGLEIQSGARGMATASTILFGVGGAAAVGGALVWLLAPPADSGRPTTPRAAIVPTTGGAAFSLSGRF
ncbi:MAG: hypothetical protein U0169_05410 [Polyangiaceae bacterium]